MKRFLARVMSTSCMVAVSLVLLGGCEYIEKARENDRIRAEKEKGAAVTYYMPMWYYRQQTGRHVMYVYTLRTCRQNVQGIPWSVVHTDIQTPGVQTPGVHVYRYRGCTGAQCQCSKQFLYVCGKYMYLCVHVQYVIII